MATRTPCSQCGALSDATAKFCAECGAARLGPAEIGEQPVKADKTPFAILVLFLLVPLGFMFFGFGSSSVKGEIRSRGKPFGTYVQKPPACHSGQHESFFGVWVAPELTKSGGRQGFRGGIKLVKNNFGDFQVFVESPLECKGFKCKIRELDPKQCKLYDVDVRNTSTSLNDIWIKEGHVNLDCSFAEGGSLSVHLEFDGCS